VWNAANETWDSAFAPRAATIPISSPNYIINGAFEINQRNFTSSTSQGFGFDRWHSVINGGTVTYSSQSFGTSPTLAPGIEATNYARMVVTGQSTAAHYAILAQPIENVKLLSGKTVTVSFWARAASGTPSIAATFDQFNGTSYTRMSGKKIAITTSWARYWVTLNVPSVSGQTVAADNLTRNRLELWFSGGSDFASSIENLGTQSNTFDVWGVQVEAGAAPTEFRRNANSLQGELAACQRYYYRLAGQDLFATIGFGTANASNQATIAVNNPVSMRTLPTAVESSGLALWDGVSSFGTTALVLRSGHQTFNTTTLLVTVAANPLPQFRPYFLFTNNNASGFFGVSAEL
jgi:hypothetical protein